VCTPKSIPKSRISAALSLGRPASRSSRRGQTFSSFLHDCPSARLLPFKDGGYHAPNRFIDGPRSGVGFGLRRKRATEHILDARFGFSFSAVMTICALLNPTAKSG
jgi:hypothetical protein